MLLMMMMMLRDWVWLA